MRKLLTVVLILIAPHAFAQDRVADSDTPAPPRAEREGGIARELIAPDQDNADQQGTEEGTPRFRNTPSTGDASRNSTSVEPSVPDGRIAPYWLPPEQNPWKLGVYAQYTDSGALITRVIPGSPAQRVGLEPGDRIVTVDGFQVGWIQDQLFPLDGEFQRHADRSGRVLLLVENVRNSRLVNIEATLERGGYYQRDDDRSRRRNRGRIDRSSIAPESDQP